MALGICIICKKTKELPTDGKTRSHCKICYKRYLWKPKLKICLRCKRERPIHAKNLCAGGYNSVFHVEKVKLHNAKRSHNIEFDIYKVITKECLICGFDKVVD